MARFGKFRFEQWWFCFHRRTVFLAGLVLLTVGNWHGAAAQACYTSSIMWPTPFMGNNGEIFRLQDGSIWEVKYEYEYLYEYYPQVVICPSRSILIVDGKKLNVQVLSAPKIDGSTSSPQPSDVIESQIDGEFEGWEGETIFKLTNGQIWQQAEYASLFTNGYYDGIPVYVRHPGGCSDHRVVASGYAYDGGQESDRPGHILVSQRPDTEHLSGHKLF